MEMENIMAKRIPIASKTGKGKNHRNFTLTISHKNRLMFSKLCSHCGGTALPASH